MTKDTLIACPKCKAPESCYVIPVNETSNSYNCLSCGFATNDLLKKDEYDVETYESQLPELFKDIKYVDDNNRVWYPVVINVESQGTVFPNGTQKENWQWSAIKSVPLTEEEKESPRFRGKKHKSDSTTLRSFGQDYFAACDYLGLFDIEQE